MIASCLLCALYITGGVSVHRTTPPASDVHADYWAYDINITRNPYGIVAIGMEKETRQFSFRVEFRHESSIATGQDHGINEGAVLVSFHPFKH